MTNNVGLTKRSTEINVQDEYFGQDRKTDAEVDEIPLAPKPSDIKPIAQEDRSIVNQETGSAAFEPISDGLYDLSYACLLIPCFHEHHLTGDLVGNLYVWMRNITISYCWRLEYINIQPEYMQWMVDVPVSVSPAQIIKTVRQRTSMKIFQDFPKFKNLNIGKDFWAQTHLVIVGRQLPTENMIREFLRLTRQQQMPGEYPIKKR